MSRSLVWGASRGTKLARKLQRDMSAWPKNAGKSGKWEEVKEKLLENCGKKGTREGKGGGKGVKRRKNWRKKEEKERELEDKGGNERTWEKGRLGSPEGRRPVTRCRQRRWNFACHVPSTLQEKWPCSNRLGKKDKNCGKNRKNAHLSRGAHWFVALGSAISGNQAQGNDLGQTALVQEWPNNCEKPTENATKLTAHSSHHCPKSSKMPQKHGKNDKFMIKISKNTTKTRQKRQFDVQNWPKEGPMFQNSFSKQGFQCSFK